MKWILETNRTQESGVVNLVLTLLEKRYDFSVVRFVPFISIPESAILVDSNTIPYGSVQFVEWAEKQGAKIWLKNKSVYEMRKAFCENYLNFDSDIMSAANVREFVKNRRNQYFIRSNSGKKLFPGKVVDRYTIDFALQDIDPMLSLIVSPKKNIIREYRFFIIGKKVITGSCYRNQGILDYYEITPENELSRMFSDVEYFSTLWDEPAYVLDIARIEENEKVYHKVLEVNHFNCSGFYACNITQIVEALELL